MKTLAKRKIYTALSCIFLIALIFFLFNNSYDPLILTPQRISISEAEDIQRLNISNAPFEIDPDCESILDYDKNRDKSILLFHGYTNCPAQYKQLIPELTEAGYNVYAPLLPYHGSIDKLTDATGYLTSELLNRHVEDSISITASMNVDITVLGISGGGVLATTALASPEVNQVVAVAPSYLPDILPQSLITPSTKLANILPNYIDFWNEKVALNNPGRPSYAYRRFSTKSIAAYQELTLSLTKSSREKTGELTIILNPNDKGINNDYARSYPEKLKDFNITSTVQHIPEEWELEHDIIDPNQSFAKPELVYPYILERLQ